MVVQLAKFKIFPGIRDRQSTVAALLNVFLQKRDLQLVVGRARASLVHSMI